MENWVAPLEGLRYYAEVYGKGIDDASFDMYSVLYIAKDVCKETSANSHNNPLWLINVAINVLTERELNLTDVERVKFDVILHQLRLIKSVC